MPRHDPELIRDGIQFASKEEVEFHLFLKDCELYGLVKGVSYQPETFELIPPHKVLVTKQLKTKKKLVERSVFLAHKYTPDWQFSVTGKFRELPHGLLVNEVKRPGTILVDVKGNHNLHGGDRVFPIHQKMMWHLKKLYVNKLIPQEFFKTIGFCPDEIRWMKNRKKPTKRKPFLKVKSFEEYFSKP